MAVSRVRSLKGVLFDTPFDLSSLRAKTREGLMAREADLIRRKDRHIPLEMTAEERAQLEAELYD